MKRNKEIVLGADPEIFVENEGNVFPAFEFLPSKYEPAKTEEGQNAYWDGFQAEFNIKASSSIAECLRSIRFGLKKVLKSAQKRNPDAKLSTKTVVDIPLELLRDLPTHLTAFGCMPSYNVYDIAGKGAEGHTVPHRFAGGHIHFGIGEQSPNDVKRIVKALDAILGVACVSLFENLDNPVRRQYYGLAGEYRLPPHGLEYRSLSDAWLFSPKVAAMVLDLARKIVEYTLSDKNTWKATDEEVVETILLSDVTKAREILKRNEHLFKEIGFNSDIDLFKPIETSVNMDDIAKNWKL